MANAYTFLADMFEELNDDCGYCKWSQYFIEGLEREKVGLNGLELGCGSGAIARALSKKGYRMDGADLSVEMLSKAEQLSRAEKLNISFYRADAGSLVVPRPYNFILSPNDCFNYISPKKLKNSFSKIKNCLTENGLFWFDISSSYKLREKIANNIFADDRENVTYLSFNQLKEDRVEMDVTLFIRREDGTFDRFDEKHTQYIHEEEAVCSALNQAGFEILRVEGHLGEQKIRSERLNFICRKK